jgi:hypothetical protein
MPFGDDSAVSIPVVLVASEAGSALLQDGAHVTLVASGGALPDLTHTHTHGASIGHDVRFYL